MDGPRLQSQKSSRSRPHSAGVLVVVAITFCLPASGFHDGGVAACNGCHVTHLGPGGTPVIDGLLVPNPSDLCLTCHADDQGEVLGADPLAPPPERGAGNFVFLLEDNLNDAPNGATSPIPGDAAGHNIVAPGHGLAADSRNSLAPGGTFPADELGCTSCHDPHGTGYFRLLNGVGPVQEGVAEFTYPAPEADGIALVGGPGEIESDHTAYISGMSDWCANCHGFFHDEFEGDFEHPVARSLDDPEIDQYNTYNGDGDPTGGTFPTAYLPEVPFEDDAMTTGSTTGPTADSRVMCLTCHRAHGSSAPYATRWDLNVTLLVEDGVASGSFPIRDPYDDPDQGTLCSKCHAGGVPDLTDAYGFDQRK